MLNIHPWLLPEFRGLQTHAAALAAGERENGASVHFVIPALDAGPVIAQARVPVHGDDIPTTLAARVLQRAHPLLIACLRLFAQQLSFPLLSDVFVHRLVLTPPLPLPSYATLLLDSCPH